MRPADLFAQIPLFQGLSDEDREALAERLAEKTFKAGAIVFSQGEQGSSMYVVQSGAVQIYLPSKARDIPPVVLKDLHTGEYFGELAIFDDKPRSASVRVVAPPWLLPETICKLYPSLTVCPPLSVPELPVKLPSPEYVAVTL